MRVLILGTRGVPACHGGFETFAEQLSLYLVSRGHEAVVYCQNVKTDERYEDNWRGVERIHIPAPEGPAGTIQFDWESVKHSSEQKGIVLTLGYNTAVFSFLYRLRGVPQVMNMDGLEWRREKWSRLQKAWLWFNELAGSKLASHLVADHPGIKEHLMRHTDRRKITVIPYGADAVTEGNTTSQLPFGLADRNYFLVIARPEPENSLLEIVEAYSSRPRAVPLIVLGRYLPDTIPYHRTVMEAASKDVHFVGAIYDRLVVQSLRYHARAYIHGHKVGGTNPSLVESLAAGNAVIAHDNRFTRWVAGSAARYFADTRELAEIFDEIADDDAQIEQMRAGSLRRHTEDFTQEDVLGSYEKLLLKWHESAQKVVVANRLRQTISGT